MTKTVIASYTTLLCMGLLVASTSMALASEVTGTLSSNSSSTKSTDTSNGSVSGTVVSERSGGGGGGGSSSSGGSRSNTSGTISTNTPTGAVLGQSTSNDLTPGFPNAGTNPEERSIDHPLWSTVLNFFSNLLSF